MIDRIAVTRVSRVDRFTWPMPLTTERSLLPNPHGRPAHGGRQEDVRSIGARVTISDRSVVVTTISATSSS